MTKFFALLAASAFITSQAQADYYPVSIQSCDQTLTINEKPQSAVSNDSNITEIMMALELGEHMAGYTGVRTWQTGGDDFTAQLANLNELSPNKPTPELLLGVDTDFFFAGWNYGLSVGKEMTPDNLANYGINTYVLTESCTHVMDKPHATINDLYNDIRNLGVIFNENERAQKLITDYQNRIDALLAGVERDEPLRTFIYDSGEDTPFTAGPYAMPQALITAAGGENVMDHLDSSWLTVGWESVVEANPELIVIIDYGSVTAEQKIDYLLNHPALTDVTAVQQQNFVVLDYAEATPGPRNIAAIERLINAINAL